MQNIDSDLIRGNIDTIILKTMLDGDMYGLDIIREVENKSNGTYELKQPTLYSCLKRLENQELISSYWLDSNIGGKRHYYKLTEKGLEKIKSKQEEWSKSKFIIDNLLGDFDSDEYRLVKKDDYEKIIEGKPVIQYITVPADESLANQNLNTQAISHSLENQTIFNQSDIDLNDYTEDFDDFDSDFSFENTINEPEEVQKVQTLSEYQSAIEDAMNSKSTIIEEDNDLICFNDNSTQKDKLSVNDNNLNENLLKSNFINTQENINNSSQSQNDSEKSDFVQQNIFDNLVYPYQNEVDNSILEFTKNISRLNDFDYSDETKRQEELEKQRLLEEENQRKLEAEKLAELKKEEQETENKISSNVDSSQFHIESIDKDFLSELDALNQKNYAIFDDAEYESKIEDLAKTEDSLNEQKNANIVENYENNTKNVALSENNAFINYKIEPKNSIQTQYGDDENSNDYSYESSSAETTGFSFQDDEPEAFFELSYSNFTPTKENEEYKKKLQNLTEYSKINANTLQPVQQNIESKDMSLLKQEFAKEGIKLRQYSKANEKETEKNHILINKLNLIKSLILLLAYTFILSASYIIMKNTKIKDILNFSIYSFIYAIIPFAVYCLYYLVLFIINPKKKTPAKYSPRIMMFFSIIITIQLLLIIYCSNLQFGFYSFKQVGYNHLLWIIPSIMSIAPIIITTIHICLYNSKNFNV